MAADGLAEVRWQRPGPTAPGAVARSVAPGPDHVAAIVALVRARTGLDFDRYRPGTVGRRIVNRMVALGILDAGSYLDRLQGQPEECWQLLQRLTIKVSRFHRDRFVFDALRETLVPQWRRREAPVRIWSVGCARGEEAYSLALLLEQGAIAGSVLATDIDPVALAHACDGCYDASALQELGANEIDAHFRAPDHAGRRQISSAVRERVRFRRHDACAGTAPEAQPFDLIACRNLLIYLQPQVQQAVQSLLVDALRPGGCLVLGQAEWPCPAAAARLEALPRALRIFRKPTRPAVPPGRFRR